MFEHTHRGGPVTATVPASWSHPRQAHLGEGCAARSRKESLEAARHRVRLPPTVAASGYNDTSEGSSHYPRCQGLRLFLHSAFDLRVPLLDLARAEEATP